MKLDNLKPSEMTCNSFDYNLASRLILDKVDGPDDETIKKYLEKNKLNTEWYTPENVRTIIRMTNIVMRELDIKSSAKLTGDFQSEILYALESTRNPVYIDIAKTVRSRLWIHFQQIGTDEDYYRGEESYEC